MKVYISGPMTGLPGLNFDEFNRVEAALWIKGYDVENPADKGIVSGWTWEDYLRYDIIQMMSCDAIIQLPGWQLSAGANVEADIAKGLHFTFLDYERIMGVTSDSI